MTRTFYRTGFYKINHSEYGGKIYVSDFDRKTSLTEIAAKIAADKKFDHQCNTNIKSRINSGGYKK